MRLSRLFAPLVKHTNRAAIHGVLTSSTPALLPLTNTSPFIAPLTTDFPLPLSTTRTQWSLSLLPSLSPLLFLQTALPSRPWKQLPSPGSLLSPLSSLHSDYMSVYPGEGVFFLDNCPERTSSDPMIVTWLASFTRCPPPVPSFFPDMLTCLSPGDRHTMPGLFANTLQLMEPSPIPLGPCAQLHLTSSLLPTPLLPPNSPAPTFGLTMWRRWFFTILSSF